jgi:hypothetical protein
MEQFQLMDAPWERAQCTDEHGMRKAAKQVADTLHARFKPTCMVLMPFAPNFNELYRRIKTTLQSKDWQAVRTDEEQLPGEIVQDIHTGLRYCDCALVVLEGLNPNVMYELGLAHARTKPTILLAPQGQRLPFDIRNLRVIEYNSTSLQIEEALAEALSRISKTLLPEVVPPRRD